MTVAEAGGVRFRDDFDSPASLRNWVIYSSNATVADGVLRLEGTEGDRAATADYVLASPLVGEWSIRARIARGTDRGSVRVYWTSGDSFYPAFMLALGVFEAESAHNYRLQYYDARARRWFYFQNLSGDAAQVRVEPGEYTEVTLGMDGGEFYMQAGGTDLHRLTISEDIGAAMATVTEVWLGGWAANTNIGAVYQFDWAEVVGSVAGGARAANRVDPEKAHGDGSIVKRGGRMTRAPKRNH